MNESSNNQGHKAQTEQTMAVVYVTDAGFAAITCASVLSLDQAASEPLDIYLLTVDLDAQTQAKMRACLQHCRQHLHFVAIDSADFARFPMPRHLPKATYGRLLVHSYVPQNYDRLLYIDGDTLVDIDPNALRSVDMQGHCFGAVLDLARFHKGLKEQDAKRLNFAPDGLYFNAGVMLIDYQQWIAQDYSGRCIAALMDDKLDLTSADQCALNYVCKGLWCKLHVRWNAQTELSNYFPKMQAIFHFLGNNKPWAPKRVRYRRAVMQRYRGFYQQSGFECPELLAKLTVLRAWLGWIEHSITPRNILRYWRMKKILANYHQHAQG